jgi:hypothetical protein
VRPKDILSLILEEYRNQRELEKKRKRFERLTKQTLNYSLIEEIVAAASKQQPGFYSTITFSDGTKWDFGIKERNAPQVGDTF